MHIKKQCSICKKQKDSNDCLAGETLSNKSVELIHESMPEWEPEDSVVCTSCINKIRADQIEKILEIEKGRLSELEREVIHSIKEHEIISENPNTEYEESTSFADRVADKVAEFGGSWKFILCFIVFILGWMGVNTYFLVQKAFDPFPYILLNLVLSCITALQAPIIMMSQNRQSAKDRIKDELEYQVNLKAELQVRQLNRKVDQFMTQQWEKFVEIQQIQNQITSSKK